MFDIMKRTHKQYNPTRGEVAKTVIIAILVTAIIAFIAGNVYANGRHDQVNRAVEAVQAQSQSK